MNLFHQFSREKRALRGASEFNSFPSLPFLLPQIMVSAHVKIRRHSRFFFSRIWTDIRHHYKSLAIYNETNLLITRGDLCKRGEWEGDKSNGSIRPHSAQIHLDSNEQSSLSVVYSMFVCAPILRDQSNVALIMSLLVEKSVARFVPKWRKTGLMSWARKRD